MAAYEDTGSFTTPQNSRDADLVYDLLQEFGQYQLMRSTHAAMWEEIAELILPSYRNTFYYGNYNWPGMKKTDRQVDASGMLALKRFGAIADSLLTPRNMIWHTFGAEHDYLMKDRATRLWYEQASKLLFAYRYRPNSGFAQQNQASYQMLGAFGTQGMFIDEIDTMQGAEPGVRYKSIPLGELYIHENHQGIVDGFIRHFRLTARQARQKWPKTFPDTLAAALEAHSQMPFNFLHHVRARGDDYDPDRLDARGKPWQSCYISIEAKVLLQEGGYDTFPLACSRYDQRPGEIYGFSPGGDVLPALKTLNAEKRTFLTQGHRAAAPVLLVADDGLIDMDMRPGAFNKGGMTSDGKPLVGVLPSGNIQISKEMMADEKAIINDSFLVTLFQILVETPQMTATEVIERTNEKGILLAPTMGRQQDEYLGPLIHRELDVLSRQRLLPPMPPLLREAKGHYAVTYTSPLARAARAQQAAGFVRTLEIASNVVNITQDHSYLDRFDYDTAIGEIADIQGVPASWLASDEQMAKKRKVRSELAKQQQAVQAAPAAAAMMKARAVAAKAGLPQNGQAQGGQTAPGPAASQAAPAQSGTGSPGGLQ